MAACRPHLIGAAGFSALVNLLYIAPTLYMLQVYDRVVPTQGGLTLLFLTLVLLLALTTLSLLDRIRTRLLVRMAAQLDAALAPALLRTTLVRSGTPFARRALREFDGLRGAISGPGMLALLDVPWTPIYLLACFIVHPAIGALAVAGVVILPLLAWRTATATRSELERAQNAAESAYASQEALVGGAEAVRALGMAPAMVARQTRHRAEMLALQADAGFSAGNYLTAGKFVRLALQSLALGLGALLAIDGQISGGAIFAASFLIARGLAPIEQLIANWRQLSAARSAYGRLDTLLAGADAAAEQTRLPPPKGALALDAVTVLDDAGERMILSGVTLAIPAGQVVAIVGPSGAGKSTLARVIAGALAPARGLVRLDGFALADWQPERLGRHVGYMPQDPALFAGTVKENIARFSTETAPDPAATDAAALAAAERAGVVALVQGLSGGFDHRLGLAGRGLSPGQAQRVALARAMFGDPALLVLDEPNAHLDPEGDAALMAALRHYKAQGHTVVIVSHKMSVLPIVDTLVMLRGGRVELAGPRDEVLARIGKPRPHAVAAAS